jgi:DNA-binding response OmpR family regulator
MLWIFDDSGGRPIDAAGGASVYRHVLIVEDEQPLRKLIARNLAGRGHSVREAATADEALAAVRAELPDLILLDINLPDRTGWDLLRELRALGISVPTIVVSAVNVSPSRLAEFRPLAHLPKPFPLDSLLRLVRGEEPPQPAEGDFPPTGPRER